MQRVPIFSCRTGNPGARFSFDRLPDLVVRLRSLTVDTFTQPDVPVSSCSLGTS